MIPQFFRERLSAWYKYVTRQNLQPDVDPLVASSWQRCLPRLNPHQKASPKRLRQEHLLAAHSANFDFISIARPIMEDIYQFIEDTETVVLLVNNAGYILDRLGDETMLAMAAANNLEEGVLISEGQVGTNALALALIDRVPTAVIGPDHFLKQFHELAGAAAPIFDPTGRALGAIGVLTEAENYHPHTLGTVVAGAKAIETQRHSDFLLKEHIEQLSELNAIISSISEGIMVWKPDGVLVHANPAAARIVNRSASTLLGRNVKANIEFPSFLEEALEKRQPLTDVEATLTIDDQTVQCMVNLHFVGQKGGVGWTVLTLQEVARVRQFVQQQIGHQVAVNIDDFAGNSRKIQRMRYLAKTAAPARASILITGESGTGKDYLARALHNASPRRNGPFAIFGCSSVPNELVISEMLGFEQRSAHQTGGGRPSKFELADGGTLFFQDIEVLPLEAQALLLNVLEFGIIQRLQGSHPIEVDVRLIASTTANLETLVADGNFRADLYYRLSPFQIDIPPLRDRTTDFPQLIERILDRLSRQHGRPLTLAPGVLAILTRYHWPGNVRELEAALERGAVQSGQSEVIGEMHLPDYIRHPANLPTQGERLTQIPTLHAMEKEAILQAAKICNGNVSQMAKVLGISRTTLWRKLKDLKITVNAYRRRQGDARAVSK